MIPAITSSGKVCESLVSSTDPFGDSSLVFKYEFEDNVLDTTGTYNGTATSLTYGATGTFGKDAIFNGSSSRIQTASISATTYAMSIFVTPASLGTLMSVAGDRAEPSKGVETGVGLYINTDSKFAFYTDPSGVISFGSVLVANTEYHVVFNVTGGAVDSVYVDGVSITPPVVTYSYTQSIYTFGHRKYIDGNSVTRYAYFLDGTLDQAELYNRILTQSEVDQLYAQSTCG